MKCFDNFSQIKKTHMPPSQILFLHLFMSLVVGFPLLLLLDPVAWPFDALFSCLCRTCRYFSVGPGWWLLQGVSSSRRVGLHFFLAGHSCSCHLLRHQSWTGPSCGLVSSQNQLKSVDSLKIKYYMAPEFLLSKEFLTHCSVLGKSHLGADHHF